MAALLIHKNMPQLHQKMLAFASQLWVSANATRATKNPFPNA
jgi:hypothetical protein